MTKEQNTASPLRLFARQDTRPLVREAIPSLAALVSRRALEEDRALSLYRHLWMSEAAAWSADEQSDFALGYFMGSMDADEAALMPPHCGAFTQNRGDHLPTARRKMAYKCGIAFAKGQGSHEAFGIVRGAAFAFGMRP